LKITDIDLPNEAFIYAAIHILANRMQTLGDKIDPTVSNKQWFVLAAVWRFKDNPPNIGEIANALGTSRQNIKKMAVILEKQGLLRIERAENDRRNIHLIMTQHCKDYLKGREQQENEYLEAIFLGIDDDILAILRSGMSKLMENMNGLLN